MLRWSSASSAPSWASTSWMPTPSWSIRWLARCCGWGVGSIGWGGRMWMIGFVSSLSYRSRPLFCWLRMSCSWFGTVYFCSRTPPLSLRWGLSPPWVGPWWSVRCTWLGVALPPCWVVKVGHRRVHYWCSCTRTRDDSTVSIIRLWRSLSVLTQKFGGISCFALFGRGLWVWGIATLSSSLCWRCKCSVIISPFRSKSIYS